MDVRWMLPAIGTLFFWAFYGVLPKMALNHMTHLADAPRRVMIWEWLGGTIVAAGILIWLRLQISAPTPAAVLGMLTGITGLVGALLYMVALRDSPLAAPVVAFTSLYPAVAVFLSYVLLRERPTPMQWAGIFLAIIAVALISAGSANGGDVVE